MSAFKSNVSFSQGASEGGKTVSQPKAAAAGRQVLKDSIVKDAAPVAAAPAVSGADAVPNKDTMRGGTVTGKVDRKFTKGNNERDLRFGSTDPGLFGSTFAATGKSMPKRGGAAATNER